MLDFGLFAVKSMKFSLTRFSKNPGICMYVCMYVCCKQKLRLCSKVKIIVTESNHMLNDLHLKTRHFWVTKIALNCVTNVICVTNQSLTMTSI